MCREGCARCCYNIHNFLGEAQVKVSPRVRGEESIRSSASGLSAAALASRLPLRLASLVSFLSLGGHGAILVIVLGSPAKACRLAAPRIVLLPISVIVVIVIALRS